MAGVGGIPAFRDGIKVVSALQLGISSSKAKEDNTNRN